MREMKLMLALGSELEVGMRVLHGTFAEEKKVLGFDTWSLGACTFLKVERMKPIDPNRSLVYFDRDSSPTNVHDDDEFLVAIQVAETLDEQG